MKAYQLLADTEETLKRVKTLGMIVAEEEGSLANTRTKLITARAAQRTVNPGTVAGKW